MNDGQTRTISVFEQIGEELRDTGFPNGGALAHRAIEPRTPYR